MFNGQNPLRKILSFSLSRKRKITVCKTNIGSQIQTTERVKIRLTEFDSLVFDFSEISLNVL